MALECKPDKIATFLSRPANQPLGKSPEGIAGYTRKIDLIFHVNYWKHIHKLNNKNKNDRMYFDGQQKIIKLLLGCEIPLFNDPTVSYPGRASFNGVTGTLTNLITGGFFHIYLHALQIPGIKVNVCVDLVTVFEHIRSYMTYDIERRKFILPDIEFDAMKQIIAILMKQKSIIPHMTSLFSESWFESLFEVYATTHSEIISKGQDTFYYENPTVRNLTRWDTFPPKYRTLFPAECALEWRDNDIIGDYPNRPSYLNRPVLGVDRQYDIPTGQYSALGGKALRYLTKIKELFISVAEEQNSNNINIGGYRGKYRRSRSNRNRNRKLISRKLSSRKLRKTERK